MDLLLKFPDSSASFAYGVEYGRLLQKIQDRKDVITNEGFPIRIENVDLLKETCKNTVIYLFLELHFIMNG